MADLNLLEAYDYELPEELIAQQPLMPRDHSRLMVYDRVSGEIQHRQFYQLLEFLRPGDCLVLNQTRVVPARLFGVRQTGGKWEGLFLRLLPEGNWQLIGQTRGRLQPGETVTIFQAGNPTPLQLKFREKDSEGRWTVSPVISGDRLMISRKLPGNGSNRLARCLCLLISSKVRNKSRTVSVIRPFMLKLRERWLLRRLVCISRQNCWRGVKTQELNWRR